MSRLRDWAEEHGYESGRCPRCRRTVWTDTGVFVCEHCGYGDSSDDEDEPSDTAGDCDPVLDDEADLMADDGLSGEPCASDSGARDGRSEDVPF